MGDVILRRDLTSVEELARLVHWGVRRRGIRSARLALPHPNPQAESPGESLARHALVTHGVPRPECGFDVIVDGGWFARADMAWPRARLTVEYDGLVHITEEQRRKDVARRIILQDAGWTLIVFTAADLKHSETMAALVNAALHRANPSLAEGFRAARLAPVDRSRASLRG